MRGLVLEGGGVKGAYHIGVLNALREDGLADFDGYVGTSIGAINSALLAAGNWDKIQEMWENINVQNVLDLDEYILRRLFKGQFDVELLGNVKKLITNLGGFIDTTTDKMRAYLKEFINEDAIRSSNKDFGLVTYSVPDFEPHYMMKEDIPEGQLYDYVMASAAYPAFKWQRIEGKENKWFIDGGVYDNMPVKMLLDKGYDEIVAIRTNIKKYFSYRKVDAGNAKITYFIPSEKLDYAINFTKDNVEKHLEMGYYDAKRTLMDLPSVHYCVRNIADDDFNLFIEKLSNGCIIEIIKNSKRKPHRSYSDNLEVFYSLLKEKLLLPSETPNSTAFINFLEIFATVFKIDRFRFYDLPDFYKWVMEYAFEESKNYDGDLYEFFRKDKTIGAEIKSIFLTIYYHYNFE